MIRWKINRKKSTIIITYNSSPLLSYLSSVGPKSPIIDARLTENIIKILSDIIYCKEYIEYFSLIENPIYHDYRVLELASIITHHYKIKV